MVDSRMSRIASTFSGGTGSQSGGGLSGILDGLGGSGLSGGLGDLLNSFKTAGHGAVADSWVTPGVPTQGLTPDQVEQAVGQDNLAELSQRTGLSREELLKRLRCVESALRARWPCETRCYVDTGQLVERSAAMRAGIGWIGKNTCVLNQELGSWLLLGVIVTSLPVAEDMLLHVAADRCGSCTRCIDACPTQALVAPREMDASRCIAYLTIEKKGSIAEELRESMGRQVFGCDICQDVCPWNRRAPVAVKEGMLARKELVNPALDWLAEMDEAKFKKWFKGSPLERTRKKRLHRNVAIAMGNSGEERFLPQLDAWSKGEDEVLAESAHWALRQIVDRAQE